MDIGEPAIVGAANRDLSFGRIRNALNKNRWVQDMNVDPEVVHVPEPSFDVLHLARFLWRVHQTSCPLRYLGELLRRQDIARQSADLPLNHPVLPPRLAFSA